MNRTALPLALVFALAACGDSAGGVAPGGSGGVGSASVPSGLPQATASAPAYVAPRCEKKGEKPAIRTFDGTDKEVVAKLRGVASCDAEDVLDMFDCDQYKSLKELLDKREPVDLEPADAAKTVLELRRTCSSELGAASWLTRYAAAECISENELHATRDAQIADNLLARLAAEQHKDVRWAIASALAATRVPADRTCHLIETTRALLAEPATWPIGTILMRAFVPPLGESGISQEEFDFAHEVAVRYGNPPRAHSLDAILDDKRKPAEICDVLVEVAETKTEGWARAATEIFRRGDTCSKERSRALVVALDRFTLAGTSGDPKEVEEVAYMTQVPASLPAESRATFCAAARGLAEKVTNPSSKKLAERLVRECETAK